jgi:MFS family permease
VAEGGPPASRIHYAWVIVGTGTLSILACLGFGRFALGMLLPSMASSLGLSYAQAGYVSTGNFLGYLAAVLACGPLARRLGARRLIAGALVLVGGSMLLLSRSTAFAPLLALYVVTGFGSGATNVPMMGLIARWFGGRARGRAAGFAAIGSGFGIILSGQLIPWIGALRGAEGWRTSWAVLGAVVLAIALLAALLLRDDPAVMGLAPEGAVPPPSGGPVAAPAGTGPLPRRPMALLSAAYALFGYTYAIYVTFIVTALVREHGLTEATAGNFWSRVGLLSLLSGPVFGTLSDRMGRRAALMLVFALQGTAYLLAAAPLPDAWLHVSIALFGVSAWSVPTIMLAAVADHVGPERALGAFGVVTFVFALGQIAGPAVAGTLAQRTGSFASSFAMAGVLCAVAIGVSAALRRSGHGAPARPR